MSQDLGIVGTMLSFPSAAFSTVSHGVSNTTNMLNDYAISPVLNGISTGAAATGSAINAFIIKPIGVVAKAADDLVLPMLPFLSVTSAVCGTACLAKGTYDYKNPKVIDKTHAKEIMILGGKLIFLSICIAANPYLRSFLSKTEIPDIKVSPYIDAIPLVLPAILTPVVVLTVCLRTKTVLSR